MKMKKFRKAIAVLLAVLLCVSAVPASVWAEAAQTTQEQIIQDESKTEQMEDEQFKNKTAVDKEDQEKDSGVNSDVGTERNENVQTEAVTDVKEDQKEKNINLKNAASFAGGNGTVENPYQISTAEQLDAVRNDLSASYVLVNDIDLSGFESWEPIGNLDQPFEGTFDGNLYIIKNLKIILDVNDKNNVQNYSIGFIGCASKGWIKNVILGNMQIITKCNLKNEKLSLKLGGIIGDSNTISVDNCTVDGKIDVGKGFSKVLVGGITGISGTNRSGGNVYNCKNYCAITVKGKSVHCGGIVGSSEYGNSVENCLNKGNIFVETESDNLYDGSKIGGIAGTSRVKDCKNFGDVTSIIKGKIPDDHCGVGGIAGGMSGAHPYVINCQNSAKDINSFRQNNEELNFINKSAYRIFPGTITKNNISWSETKINGNKVSADDLEVGLDKKHGKSVTASELDEAIRPEEPMESENEYIINRVKAYTTDKLHDQLEAILNSDIPDDLKFQKVNELFIKNGILDPKEGITYLQNTIDERTAFRMLTENDAYCATNYTAWLHSDNPKAVLARAALYSSGLILNGEFFDYINPNTYLKEESPEIKKYKAMFWDFIKDGEKEIEFSKSFEETEKLINTSNLFDITERDQMISELSKTTSMEEINSVLNNWWVKLYPDGTATYEVMDKTELGELLGGAGKTIKFASLAFEDVELLIKLSANFETYNYYKDFFYDVAYSDNELPSCMKAAAAQVSNEFENKIQALCKNIGGQVTDYLVDKGSELLFEAAGLSVLSEAFAVIKIETWIANQIIKTDVVVQKVACVEGFARLSDYYAAKLIYDKADFQETPNAENAWKFYNDYKILYQLRLSGESAYLEMSSPDNTNEAITKILVTNNFKLRKEVVDDTIKYLKGKCAFILPEGVTPPAEIQYNQKIIAQCPVDMEIYDNSGNLVYSIKDGEESDVANEYGRFVSTYRAFTGDYTKIASLNDTDKYTIKLKGTDTGIVTTTLTTMDNNGNAKVFKLNYNEINKGGCIQFESDQNPPSAQIDIDGDGRFETSEIMEQSNQDTEKVISVSAIKTKQESCLLKIGESIAIGLDVTPVDATYIDVEWTVENPEIASVQNGKVIAKNTGTTKVVAKTLDNSNLFAECKITVESNSPSKVKVKKVELDKTKKELTIGERFTLIPTITPDNATEKAVTWSSSDNKIATVDKNGLVTAVAEGKATITVATKDGNKTAACEVTVTKREDPSKPEEPSNPTTPTVNPNDGQGTTTTGQLKADTTNQGSNPLTGMTLQEKINTMIIWLAAAALCAAAVLIIKRRAEK